jgi:hypothetical protein
MLENKGFITGDSNRPPLELVKDKFDKMFNEYHSRTFEPTGPMYLAFKTTIKEIADTHAKIVLVFLPMTDYFKEQFANSENNIELIKEAYLECNKYTNCIVMDYFNWDNRKLGSETEDHYFHDFMHMNVLGGKSFSKILKNDLHQVPQFKDDF